MNDDLFGEGFFLSEVDLVFVACGPSAVAGALSSTIVELVGGLAAD